MRNYYSIPLAAFLLLGLPRVALAHCPLCVAGAGVGLTLTRWIGVDDSITGVWLAAFLGATAFWTYSALNKKLKIKENLKVMLKPIIYVLFFILTIWSFYKFNLVVKHGDIFGIHKLTFGMIVGAIVFYLVDIFDDFLIKRNGKVFFPYQRIIMSLGSVFFLSIAIYILINYFV